MDNSQFAMTLFDAAKRNDFADHSFGCGECITCDLNHSFKVVAEECLHSSRLDLKVSAHVAHAMFYENPYGFSCPLCGIKFCVKGQESDFRVVPGDSWKHQAMCMVADEILDISHCEEHIFVGNKEARCEAVVLTRTLDTHEDVVRLSKCNLVSDTSVVTLRNRVRPVCDFHAVKNVVFFLSLFLQFSGVSAAGANSTDLLDSFVKIAYILLLVLLARVLWKFGTGLEIIMQNLTICISGFSEFVAFKRQWWCLDMLPAVISAGAIFANTWFMHSTNPFQFVKQGYFADKVKDGASLTAILVGTLMFATVPVFGFQFASGKFKSWLAVLKESSYIAWFVHIVEHWCETGDIKIPDDPHHVGSREWREFTKASGYAWSSGEKATDEDISQAKEDLEEKAKTKVRVDNPYSKVTMSLATADDVIEKNRSDSSDSLGSLSSDSEAEKLDRSKKEILSNIDDSTGIYDSEQMLCFSDVCEAIPAIESHATKNYSKDVMKGYEQVVKVYNYCYGVFADMNQEYFAKNVCDDALRDTLKRQGILLVEFFNVLFDVYDNSYVAKEIMKTNPELLGSVLCDLHYFTTGQSKELGETIHLVRKLKVVRTAFLALLPPMPVEKVTAPSIKMKGGLGSKIQKQYSKVAGFIQGETVGGIMTTVKQSFDMSPLKRKAQYCYCWLISKYADWQLSDKSDVKPEEKRDECVRVFKKFSFTAFLWTSVTTIVVLGIALGAAVVKARETFHEDCLGEIPNVPRVSEKGTKQVSGKDYVKKMYTRDARAEVPKQAYENNLYEEPNENDEEPDFEDFSDVKVKGTRAKRRGKAVYGKIKQAMTFKLGDKQFEMDKDELIGYVSKHQEIKGELQSIIADPPIKINAAVERTFSVYFRTPSGERYYLMNAHLVTNKFVTCGHMFDMHEEIKANFVGVEPEYIIGKDGNEWVFKKSQFVEFISADDLGYFPANTGFSMDRLHARVPKDGEMCLLIARDADLGHGEVPNLSSGVCSSKGFYTCSSAAGFCGAPVVAASDGHLLGFHQAGSKIGNFFCPFTKELIEEMKAPLMPKPRHF